MPTYAIVGATGKTGNALITHLLKSPQIKLNLYCRTRSKLLAQFPRLDENNSVQIFDGALNDVPLIASCIDNVDVIFAVLGENENTPGIRISQDAAQTIVAGLCHLGCTNGAPKVPRLIFLSSCSLNPRMYVHEPTVVHWIVSTGLSNAYADLTLAAAFLKLHESWLKVTFIQPGALTEDEQRGHKLSLDRKGAPPFVSYADLTAGMIEVAEVEKYDGLNVSVVSTSRDVKFEWAAPRQIARGFLWHYFPSVGWMAKYVGLF